MSEYLASVLFKVKLTLGVLDIVSFGVFLAIALIYFFSWIGGDVGEVEMKKSMKVATYLFILVVVVTLILILLP